MKFEDYKIKVVPATNYIGRFVAYIEELHNVIGLIDQKKQAAEKLKPLFDNEMQRLTKGGLPLPAPGSGKAIIIFGDNNKIETLRPFIDDFWNKILGISYSSSYVSDESCFYSWEHLLDGGKEELIKKVKQTYSIDITTIYEQPIYSIVAKIKEASAIN